MNLKVHHKIHHFKGPGCGSGVTFNTNTGRQSQLISEFEASLVDIASSRVLRTT